MFKVSSFTILPHKFNITLFCNTILHLYLQRGVINEELQNVGQKNHLCSSIMGHLRGINHSTQNKHLLEIFIAN